MWQTNENSLLNDVSVSTDTRLIINEKIQTQHYYYIVSVIIRRIFIGISDGCAKIEPCIHICCSSSTVIYFKFAYLICKYK